jgi:putative redox protein
MKKSVKASLREGYTVTSETRGHRIHADEPLELGGNDSAPKPSELVLAGLASCKMITCKMYAERKLWPLEEIEIELSIEEEEPMVIYETIRFLGELDEDQCARLKVISGRCPVVRMLHPDYRFVHR